MRANMVWHTFFPYVKVGFCWIFEFPARASVKLERGGMDVWPPSSTDCGISWGSAWCDVEYVQKGTMERYLTCVCVAMSASPKGDGEKKEEENGDPFSFFYRLLSGSLYGCTGAWSDCHISVRKKRARYSPILQKCFTLLLAKSQFWRPAVHLLFLFC